jgi:peptidoglycan/LPS O-acetylase OafA/YrhL
VKSARRDPSKKTTLSNVDLLRGLAAFTILFWHYEAFYNPDPTVAPMFYLRHLLPLASIFGAAYLHGDLAVPFFWALSGFVFFHVYAKRREATGWEFFVNRFTRLYPLHLVTLCVVAMLQVTSWYYFSKFQIYPFNDPKHFFLNLAFAPYWGLQDGFSFNAPVWSVSVELFAYLAFFAYLKAFGITHLTSALFVGWGLLLAKATPGLISDCCALFAIGGFTQRLHLAFVDRAGRGGSLVAALLGLVLAYLCYSNGLMTGDLCVRRLVFPGVIWVAAALDGLGISSGRVGDRIGSLSYASYLVHVPIQLCLVLWLDAFVGSRAAVASPYFLLLFIVLVLVVSWLAHRFLELPAQRVGRAAFLHRYGKMRTS